MPTWRVFINGISSTDDHLVIAGATEAGNYDDWSIRYQDDNGGLLFEGEPLLDQQRLLTDGVLSVLIQDTNFGNAGIASSDLHVFDFAVAISVPEPASAILLCLGMTAICCRRHRKPGR